MLYHLSLPHLLAFVVKSYTLVSPCLFLPYEENLLPHKWIFRIWQIQFRLMKIKLSPLMPSGKNLGGWRATVFLRGCRDLFASAKELIFIFRSASDFTYSIETKAAVFYIFFFNINDSFWSDWRWISGYWKTTIEHLTEYVQPLEIYCSAIIDCASCYADGNIHWIIF